MRSQLLVMVSMFLFGVALNAAETPTAAVDANTITFKAGHDYYYNYLSEQKIVQKIADDEIKTNSTLSWQFVLHCEKNTEKEAHLTLSIVIIRASIDAPGFKHDIDTSRAESQMQVPLIGHLSLLNGKTLKLVYDYQRQRLSSLSGTEAIHHAFLKLYPRDEFEETDDPRYLKVKEQYSDTHLLRLWREILRPPGSGEEHFQLDQPIGIAAKRSWKAGEQGSQAFTLSSADPAKAPMITLNLGPNPVKAQLKSLSGNGSILVKEQTISQAKGSVSADLAFEALTHHIEQQVVSSWQLQLVKVKLRASEK